MFALRRPLGLLVALSLSSIPCALDAVGDAFDEGVQFLRRGRDAEALMAFQRVLSLDPDSERALELWQSAESGVFLDLLRKGGEFEKVGKALMGLVREGRKARRDDADAIRGLLRRIATGDVGERRRAQYTLASDHGEFAVPYMLPSLGDRNNEERRLAYMQALSEMGSRATLPLVAALDSPDEYLRRNVAQVLGLIGDRRSAPALAHRAAGDSGGGVRAAAREALDRMSVSGDAEGLYVALGRAYLIGSEGVDAPHLASDVVWKWGEAGLEYEEVPQSMRSSRLAQDAYFGALAVDPGSVEARAGIAHASAAVVARGAAEEDDGAAAATLAISVAGPDAVDLALREAMSVEDFGAAAHLARALGTLASSAGPGLVAALNQERSAGVRGEAAASMASIAYRSGRAAAPEVVSALAEAAARRSLRIAAVIDGDDSRAMSAATALEQMGFAVHPWKQGARALLGLRRLPGVDVIVLADSLPDVATDTVLDAIRANSTTADTPVLILTADADRADELYGEKSQGTVSTSSELVQADELAGEVTGDRARAQALARRAATALAHLAGAGHSDLSGIAQPLAASLEGAGDAILTPSLHALRACGSAGECDAIAAVLADEGTSDEARVAAATALLDIFGRGVVPTDGTLDVLRDVSTSDASLAVRNAAMAALGRLDLTSDLRATLLASLR